MSYHSRSRSSAGHLATSPSPLRHTSNASSGSSAYSNYSNQYPPSRTSTVSSASSNEYHPYGAGHKRGVSEAMISPIKESHENRDITPTGTYKAARQSLRPLPQAPAHPPAPMETSTELSHTQSTRRLDPTRVLQFDGSNSQPAKARPHSMALSRSDSMRAPTHKREKSRADGPAVPFPSVLEKPQLESFQKSTTGHLRTLSKFAENEDEFGIKSPEQAVIGMQGRRRLQRSESTRGKKSTAGYGGRIWMDQQRQFLQAYEYLCHIGEAKEWIEDIINKPIPPIVQLEEALRDGVTLAEVVQALNPERPLRIFRHQKLQFRHSDNIALFFRLLADIELPELFWFELVDLYEKKNIPKVIYCIHALSWLLFRKGIVDFRIGNLVGQLQFEDHELEAMQKGLDKAGISLPNFSGMGASFGAEPEPEPEPVENEEDRIHRKLGENESAIAELQAQIRGALMRLQLGQTMEQLWDAEAMLVDLQSRIRGDFGREIVQYRMDMRKFATNLQSASRGFLVRSRQQQEEDYWQDQQKEVVVLQSLVRARKARAEVKKVQSRIQRHEHGIRSFQAAIRGAVKRWDIGDQYHATRQAEADGRIQDLQAAIRGALSRKRFDEQYEETRSAEGHVQLLQAAVRGMLQRKSKRTDKEALRQHHSVLSMLQAGIRGCISREKHFDVKEQLESQSPNWTTLQSVQRGRTVRKSFEAIQQALQAQSPMISMLQAVSRGAEARQRVAATREGLANHEDSVLDLQCAIRGGLLRKKQAAERKALQDCTSLIVDLQSVSRGSLVRQQIYDTLYEANEHEDALVEFQSILRATLLRNVIGDVLEHLTLEEDAIVELQALARGRTIRSEYAEKIKHYKRNMEKVIKIQSFVRGRQQGEAYKILTSGANPPVGTVKNFVHLLNDSDFDFDEELEFERLRKTVVQHVRQNEMAEQYVDQLDIKIALLVKNKITLDEVIKHQKHFGGHVGSLLTNKDISSKDPFDLKALNKNSRKKLEHYQELFFFLQTQPHYLARLFKRIREQGTAEKECKRIELLMMGLFGIAQKRREEYYLLRLVARSIKEEVDGCASLQDYLRGNFFWAKLLGNYIRSPRDRKYLRDLLSPMIKEDIVENEGLDLESDPIQIYRSAINNEELRTGQRSRKNPDVPREGAIRDPETRETFIRHLQDLRDIADHFFLSLEELMHKMPYGIRFVAQQTFELLRGKFPYESEQHILRLVGNWVWKTYIQPAMLQPDNWGVVDRGLSPLHKRNLGEVAKVVGQIAAGRLFGGENVYLQPINPYIQEALGRIEDIWHSLITIRSAEAQFDIDEFNDLYARQKPTLYIKLTDIFAIHHLVAADVAYVCPAQDDVLREVIRELGSAKNNESEMMGVQSSQEITLTLTAKFHDVEDPEAPIKSLFMETKRVVLYIIRIQTGPDLLGIMVQPITNDHEDRWASLIQEELSLHNSSKKRSAYTDSTTNTALLDITSLTYTELKRTALENILTLERTGRISRHNKYQDLLNAIALDIRTKHQQRIQRSREMETVRATLGALDEKARWLEGQLQSYNNYIEQAMVTLQNKSGRKKRFLLPFTKQYNHERELARTGRTPRFGSYKYSARTLADKGVLVSWAGYDSHRWDKLNITFSSDEVGIFHVEGSMGSMMIPGASAVIPLDDLLQAQFNNLQFMNLFAEGKEGKKESEGALRLNVNLLVHLLMRKFYRDE